MYKKLNIKIVVIILVSLIVISFGGILLLSLYLNKAEEESTPLTESTMETADEILQADIYDGYVQIGTEIIQVPCSLETVLGCGVVLTDATYNEAYLLDIGESMNVPVEFGGMSFTVSVCNESDTIERLVYCDVVGLNNLTNATILFPGGVGVGVQGLEALETLWGSADVTSSVSTKVLDSYYYREGISMKDIYAWDNGGAGVADATSVVDINGTGYEITFDRSTGYITEITASFQEKSGATAMEERLEYFAMGTVSIPYLQDCVEVDNDDLSYCVQTIGGIEYVIGVGVVEAEFDEQGTFLETETSEVSVETIMVNEEGEEEVVTQGFDDTNTLPDMAKGLLSYDSYDFSQKYEVVKDESDWKSYYGESVSESVYFGISAEVQKKSACGIVFYLHPLEREATISEEALSYIRNLVEVTREGLIFN